jgi:SAM-dependent methyltransferase
MDIDFNKKTFEKMEKMGLIGKQDSILVVGGLKPERDLFVFLGFKNVTISNIINMESGAFSPFGYIQQDARRLNFPCGSFDFVFVSASLHHCSSPVGALLEMYRVAKKGIVLTEARDSFVMRLAQRLKIVRSYECEAITGGNIKSGGVDNTEIPNYVYRWTERELEKIVSSFNPVGNHKFLFFYKFSPSFSQARLAGNNLRYFALKFTAILFEPVALLFKKQSNFFSAVILKPRIPADLFPWLKAEGGKVVFNREFKG